ncbi:MAG: DegT/DnrJ/EryC1/StrS family aminotransferase [Bacteroidota bacterium]|nr:DegT/DnrJ/EryC1/StrS family aminotransferase [Bacteroidota bacterium]
MKPIQMVDLASQYHRFKPEIDNAISDVLNSASYINGPAVKQFSKNLEAYLDVKHVIPCANGTDALQIALMALDLPEGSEVITPGFSYIALAEVCCLLKLKPVYVDVDKNTFNIDVNQIEALITKNTKVIAPVHLYGQCADMESIMKIAQKYSLFVIEDNAQSIGADYVFSDGKVMKSGTIGDIGTTSFFPSKNLGCYGDGGAIYTNNDALGEKLKMIANHGQRVKYIHDVVGVNSRLDSVQAAVLNVKLNHLDTFNAERQEVAKAYDLAFANHKNLKPPFKSSNSSHVYHQYTLQTCAVDIPKFREAMQEKGIPTMIYYPLPLYKQNAYQQDIQLPIAEMLSNSVVSLPIGTDMEEEQIKYIINTILNYFN